MLAFQASLLSEPSPALAGVVVERDRVARDRDTALVAIIAVGERRPFRLRPKGGGPSVGYQLGRGDLLVMGGTCQRTWDHSVPKVARAGPRISLTFRPAEQELTLAGS